MTPAQKAWVTRKARAAALATTAVALVTSPMAAVVNVSTSATVNAAASANPAAASRMEAVEKARVIELYVNEANFCGQHLFVVLETGPDMVRLFHPSRLETVTVARKYFDRNVITPKRGTFSKVRIAACIRKCRALADKINDAEQRTPSEMLRDGGADGVRALELLEA